MRIVGLRLICHHSFLSTRRSSRKSLRILYHSVLNKGKWKSQHETGEEVQLSMSFLLTHILWFSDPSSVDCGPGRASLVVPASRVDAVGLPLRFVVERLALCRIV